LLRVTDIASLRLILPFLFALSGVLASTGVLVAGRPTSVFCVASVIVALQFPTPLGMLFAPCSGTLPGAVGVCGRPLTCPRPIGCPAVFFHF
jgi:hypothetical protein